MASTVSAVCSPQRWPGGSGVGGGLDHHNLFVIHLCVCGRRGWGQGCITLCAPVGVLQIGGKYKLCACVAVESSPIVYIINPLTTKGRHTRYKVNCTCQVWKYGESGKRVDSGKLLSLHASHTHIHTHVHTHTHVPIFIPARVLLRSFLHQSFPHCVINYKMTTHPPLP